MVHIFLYIAAIPFNKQPLSTVPRQDPPDRPGWISKIQTSGREVLVHLQLTSSERQQLQLSTGGGASSACRARLERLDTGEVWMLPLSAGCSSAKWTRDGLKLTLEDMDDMDESMISPPWKISKSQETGEAFHSASRLVILLKMPKSDSTRYDQMILVISVRRVENDPVNAEAELTSR